MSFAASIRTQAGGHCARRRPALIIAAALVACWPSHGMAKVRISGLADINFGTLANLEADAVQSQSLCLYSQTDRYAVRADGSGAGGAFTLSGGGASLPYEVRWSAQSGQTNGTALSPGALLSGLTTNAQTQNCGGSGPPATASLILVLPATALSGATQGSYSGTLTLIVSEE